MNKLSYFALLWVLCLTVSCEKENSDSEKEQQEQESENETEKAVIDENGNYTDPRDGHVYKTVKIGNQVWLAENLAYIPSLNKVDDHSYTEPMYYIYYDETGNLEQAKLSDSFTTYGVHYNYDAAKEACPAGWHLPTKEEWIELANFVSKDKGPYAQGDNKWEHVGGHLKSYPPEGQETLWRGFECEAGTDDYGFRALPAGRVKLDTYETTGSKAYWWTANVVDENYADAAYIGGALDFYISDTMARYFAYSVRCVLND